MCYPRCDGSCKPQKSLLCCVYCYLPGGIKGAQPLVRLVDDLYIHPGCSALLGTQVAAELYQRAKAAVKPDPWKQLEEASASTK